MFSPASQKAAKINLAISFTSGYFDNLFSHNQRKASNGRDALGQDMGNTTDVNFMLSCYVIFS